MYKDERTENKENVHCQIFSTQQPGLQPVPLQIINQIENNFTVSKLTFCLFPGLFNRAVSRFFRRFQIVFSRKNRRRSLRRFTKEILFLNYPNIFISRQE